MFQLARRTALLILLLLMAGIAMAEDVGGTAGYDLSVDGELVSMRVVNGSLVEIVEKLGGLFDFEVIANLREDVRVSVDFDELPLSDAIREICAPIGYVEAPDPDTGKIARLVLVSGGGSGMNRAEARREPLPQRPVQPPDPGERSAPSADEIARARAEQARSSDEKNRKREEAQAERGSRGSSSRPQRSSRGNGR